MTTINGSIIDITELKRLYTNDPTAKIAFDYFATKKRNKHATTVDRLYAVLVAQGHKVSYSEIREFLRNLANLNCGEFKIGRRGWASRLEWNVGLVSLGQAAAGHRSEVMELTEDEARDADENDETEEREESLEIIESSDMKVVYPLRPTRNVEIVLPKDLTAREASRLAEFIKTLPFEEADTQKQEPSIEAQKASATGRLIDFRIAYSNDTEEPQTELFRAYTSREAEIEGRKRYGKKYLCIEYPPEEVSRMTQRV